MGEVALFLGEFLAAKTYCEDSVALYDPQLRDVQTSIYGEEPAIGSRVWLALGLFLLGHPDRALQTVREALTATRELAHGNSLTFASFIIAWIHACRREPDEAREHREAVSSLATEQEMPFWLAWGTMMQGGSLGMQGDGQAGVAEIRQGLAIYQATEAAEGQTYAFVLPAEVYRISGQIEEGLATVTEALAVIGKNGERFWEAELYRIKGNSC